MVPQEGLRTGNVHRGSVMRVIVALVLGILFATAVVSAWGIWIIETSEIR
jgi:NhaP-type Na+/H+ or K+/H+ antiporter